MVRGLGRSYRIIQAKRFLLLSFARGKRRRRRNGAGQSGTRKDGGWFLG
jgi:hypothetical protein